MSGLASEHTLRKIAGERAASTSLQASAALPSAGAYQADPSGTTRLVEIPEFASQATIFISYTRGGSGGYAAHKVFLGDGTRVGQVLSPANDFSGISGRAPTSASAVEYSLTIDLKGGATRLGIASAEVGNTGSPGTLAALVAFS